MKKMTAFILCVAACGGTESPDRTAFVEQAEMVEHNIRTPVDVVAAQIGCPETLHITGSAHTLVALTINGNTFHATLHFNSQDVTAVGLATGDVYLLSRADTTSINGSFVNGVYSETRALTAITVSPGDGLVRRLERRLHITVNANGEVTVFFDDFTVICPEK
jgi:hypothetical protein